MTFFGIPQIFLDRSGQIDEPLLPRAMRMVNYVLLSNATLWLLKRESAIFPLCIYLNNKMENLNRIHTYQLTIQNLQNDTVTKCFVRQTVQYICLLLFQSSIFGTWPQDAIEVKCGTDVPDDHLLEMCITIVFLQKLSLSFPLRLTTYFGVSEVSEKLVRANGKSCKNTVMFGGHCCSSLSTSMLCSICQLLLWHNHKKMCNLPCHSCT